jgi:hypothetical protein
MSTHIVVVQEADKLYQSVGHYYSPADQEKEERSLLMHTHVSDLSDSEDGED